VFEKFQIRGFQKHKDLTIEFGEGVTTIIGPSDKGKSAILRALECLITNEPSGTSYLNWETNSAAMRLFFDGGIIKKIRNSKKHVYEFNEEVYKSFGVNVPEPIVRALNVSPLSFQSQFDPPFWFSSTAGEVSRQLNQIVNLDLIDVSLASIASMLKTSSAKKEILESRLKGITEQLEQISYVDDINNDLERLEKLEKQLTDITNRKAQLESFINQINQTKKRITTQKTIYKDGQAILELGKEYRVLSKRKERLQSLLTTAQEHYGTLGKRPPSIDHLIHFAEQIKSTSKRRLRLMTLITKSKQFDLAVFEARRQRQNLKKQFETEIGKTCPLCGKPQ